MIGNSYNKSATSGNQPTWNWTTNCVHTTEDISYFIYACMY